MQPMYPMTSESEHMIQAKCSVVCEKAVVAEKPAGGIPDQYESTFAGSSDRLFIECLVEPPMERTATWNLYHDGLYHFSAFIM